jgi:hypothetical protein
LLQQADLVVDVAWNRACAPQRGGPGLVAADGLNPREVGEARLPAIDVRGDAPELEPTHAGADAALHLVEQDVVQHPVRLRRGRGRIERAQAGEHGILVRVPLPQPRFRVVAQRALVGAGQVRLGAELRECARQCGHVVVGDRDDRRGGGSRGRCRHRQGRAGKAQAYCADGERTSVATSVGRLLHWPCSPPATRPV